MTPDEVGRLRGDDALLFISREYVFKDRKYTVSEHPKAELLANSPRDNNWYRYKRFKDETEELLYHIDPENIIDHGMLEAVD